MERQIWRKLAHLFVNSPEFCLSSSENDEMNNESSQNVSSGVILTYIMLILMLITGLLFQCIINGKNCGQTEIIQKSKWHSADLN